MKNWNDGKVSEFKNRKTYDPATISKADSLPCPACEQKKQAAEAAPAETPRKAAAPLAGAETILLTTKTCPNCRMAKRMLSDAGIPFHLLYAEDQDGAQVARTYDISAVPTLLTKENNAVHLYYNVKDIRQFIQQHQ